MQLAPLLHLCAKVVPASISQLGEQQQSRACMVIPQFTEDRPSFLSALMYLVFRTTTCHMNYFYSPDAERHREVKLLKVMNSAEQWGGGGVMEGPFTKQTSGLLCPAGVLFTPPPREGRAHPPTPAHPPRPSTPSISAGAPNSRTLLPPLTPQSAACAHYSKAGTAWLIIQLLRV